MSTTTVYFLGFFTPFALFGLFALAFWLLETGRSSSCDRHGWSTGPSSSTRRWRRVLVTRWHLLRWHSFGQQPLAATDRWIVDNAEWLWDVNRSPGRRRRVVRGVRMAREALGLKP